MNEPEILMRMENASFLYDNKRGIKDASVNLYAGQSAVLIGPNGAGKTTLLNLLAGITKPSGGCVERSPKGERAKKEGTLNISYLPQTGGEISWMPLTVLEALKMSRYKKRGLLRRFSSHDFSLIDEAGERMEITGLYKKQFSQLSAGQRQRVRLAVAFAQEPDILLMDEPSSGLDIPSQERIQKATLEEMEKGTAVALATHSLEEAVAGNEVLLMDGDIVAQGTPEETLTEDNLRLVYKDRLQLISGDRLVVLDHHEDHPH